MMKEDKENITESRLLTVHEAALYLGVHAGTIRRWAYAKKLKGRKIGIRGDWRFHLSDLAKEVQSEILTMDESTNNSQLKNSSFSSNGHFVQFYEKDEYLVDEVVKFLVKGDAAIVVGSANHREMLEKNLQSVGLSPANLNNNGHYIYLDALETLGKFMINGLPDPDLFFETIGGILTKTSRNKKKVNVFGEMVALLWAEGNHQAALALEKLWNELQKIHSFTLFCAYPMKNFNEKNHSLHFSKINDVHSIVLPTERYSSLNTEDKRLREIALLQQKAQMLESEIIKHTHTELKLLHALNTLKKEEQRKDDFISAASHELKTPLTSQKVYVQLLRRLVEKDTNSKYTQYVSKINEQTDKLSKLISNLLDVSKMQSGKLHLNYSIFDIYTCIKNCVEEVQAISTTHKIMITGSPLGNICADEEKISQVIINLLTNATKYSPNARKVIVSLQKDTDTLTISVKDFGIGINKKHQSMIFDRFYRVDDEYGKTYPGLGIGLYITSEIVRQHNGKISVKSKPSQGSVFSFTLPLSSKSSN